MFGMGRGWGVGGGGFVGFVCVCVGQFYNTFQSDRSFIVDPLSSFSFQPVLYDWCNKGRGMCYPLCGMVYIKEPLLLIGKSSPCGGSGFPLSLSEWSLMSDTI